MKKPDLKNNKLPDAPGVYLFKKGRMILYVGKATSLKDRVKSYFTNDLLQTRGPLLVKMVQESSAIHHIKTDSVLEALILEANLIKKHQPYYNTKEKDNKSFNYIIITKENFPRVLIVRGREIEKGLNYQILDKFGPFSSGESLRKALKIIRKIFSFRDKCVPNQTRPCFNYQLGLCPGVCLGLISKKDYRNVIRNIKLFFQGKKKRIILNLEKEMKSFAKKGEYEMAGELRNKIFALNHIQDVAIIASEATIFSPPQLRRGDYSDNRGGCLRIEAYDVAHLSGTNNVGVMVVLENGEFKKSDYRKFKIKESKGSDITALREILERRLKHPEWPTPDLIVVDGGMAQLNVASKVYKNSAFGMSKSLVFVSLVAVTKDSHHRPKAILGPKNLIKKYKKKILLLNNEAHRFAIAFHRQKRNAIIQ